MIITIFLSIQSTKFGKGRVEGGLNQQQPLQMLLNGKPSKCYIYFQIVETTICLLVLKLAQVDNIYDVPILCHSLLINQHHSHTDTV